MSRSPQHIDQYTLQECLGRSDIVETWKALDTQAQRHVILKIYTQNKSDFLSQFLQTAQAIASLQHPNIVHIDAIQTFSPPQKDGTIGYLIMGYIEGPTLAEYISQTSGVKKFPSAENIVHLFSALSSAIDYAHQQGVIHRNIKPSNILLNSGAVHNQLGEPMLTDFRIAGLSISSPITPGRGVSWPGTPLYLSPEQVKGYIGNELSDIYALGVILYEVCTGVPPFQGEDPNAIISQHIEALPPSPVLVNPMISPTLAAVILRSIAKDPASRYSNALSMANALADAFNLPMPENLTVPEYFTDQMSEPTYYKPLQTHPLPYSTPALPVMQSSSSLPAIATTPQSVTPLGNTPGTPITGEVGIAGAIAAQSVSGLPTKTASPVTSPESASLIRLPLTPTPPAPKRSRKGLIITLIAIVILVLAGSGVGTFLLLNHSTPTIVASPIVGYAYFVSSGHVNENSTQGINDELLIELHNVRSPAPGKSYYAWLLSDTSQVDGIAILLGKLTVKGNNVHFPYPGDAQHTNLLAISSRFLVTQEDANIMPTNPTPDRSEWVYYAELPQKADPTDPNHLSVLDHLRDLLSQDPKLQGLGLAGGLDIWLYRNTEKILEWSGSARDYNGNTDPHAPTFMRNQLIRILDFLDGVSVVQEDLPGVQIIGNQTEGAIGLLGQNQGFPSFLQLIGGHLSSIVKAPGITRDSSKLADQINTAINYIRNWLEHVYQDAKQLYAMSDPQLVQPASLATLDDMVNYALFAYVGHHDPSTNQIQEGVVQIHDSIQRLATLDITAHM